MSRIRCFLVEDTKTAEVYLRRYERWNADRTTCDASGYGSHDASVIIGIEDTVRTPEGRRLESLKAPVHEDPRWPKHCACGYEFQEHDEWQIGQHELYAPAPGNDGPNDLDRGAWIWPVHRLPVGAMFYPSWYQPEDGEEPSANYLCPTDGTVLMVITPDNPDGTGTHQWLVDQYCSNCTRRGEVHHCWCRSGTAPWITVNKTPPSSDNYGTCQAGAGSIWTRMPDGWHGHLTNGYLHT